MQHSSPVFTRIIIIMAVCHVLIKEITNSLTRQPPSSLPAGILQSDRTRSEFPLIVSCPRTSLPSWREDTILCSSYETMQTGMITVRPSVCPSVRPSRKRIFPTLWFITRRMDVERIKLLHYPIHSVSTLLSLICPRRFSHSLFQGWTGIADWNSTLGPVYDTNSGVDYEHSEVLS